MSYFTGNRLRDLFMLLQISLEWGRLYPENLDIVDNSKQEDDALPDTDGVPDAQGWITWKGGECPIPDAEAGEYELRFSNGETRKTMLLGAAQWKWRHTTKGADYNIVAYRLVKPDHSQLANSEQNDYPVMEGFHKHDCNTIPFGILVRVQRRDKSFSEGNSAGFNWNENGMDTIIGWKPV